MTTRLLTVAYGAPATALLGRLVAGARGDDPLAPVTVVVPSAAAGVTLRRRLAVDLGGLVNVAVTSLPRLAADLAAPVLADAERRPLPPALGRAHRRAALRGSALVDDRSILASAATERAVEVTLAELSALDDRALEALTRRGGTTESVVDVHHRFVAATAAAGYASAADGLRAAVEGVRSGRADLAALGSIVLHLPRRLVGADLELLAALVDARIGLTVVVGTTGDSGADAIADTLVALLRPLLGPDHPADALRASVPAPTQLVRVPDPAEEVAVAVRQVVAAITGADGNAPVRSERIAVVSRVRDPYTALLHERLTAAGVVHHGPSVTTLAQSVPGRLLLGLLDVAAGGMRRADVAALLRAGPILDPATGHRVPAPYWDRLAREAGVLGGLDQWRARLQRSADARRESLALWAVRDELDDDATAALLAEDRRLATLAALEQFVVDLASRLVPPADRRWATWAASARALLETYLHADVRRQQEAATDAVDAAIAGLGGFDGVDDPPDPERFRRALEVELGRPDRPHGRFGHGVFVGRLVDVAGADLDLVVVVGAADGSLPPRRRDDALIPDRERAAAGGALPPRSLRRDEEHRDLLAALAAAPTSVLVAPRADPREQRERQPAPWFLDLAGARAGRLVGSDELSALARAVPWLSEIESFEAGVTATSAPASIDEADLRDLVADHREGRTVAAGVVAAEHPALRRGLEAAASRRAGRFDEWSGRVGVDPGLLERLDRPRSPTGLERYAICPFRSFLGDVLGVGVVDDPTDVELISALDEGSLVHEVLELFIGAHLDKPPDEPWSELDRLELVRVADTTADRYEIEGRTGRPLLWRVRRAQLHHQLQRFLDRDERYRAANGVGPAAVELAFGIGDEDDATPVAVELAGGRRLAFKGIIDRVDRSPDGRRLVVSDYKTGKPDPFRSIAPRGGTPDLTARGTKLQLPIYAIAARSRYPGAETVDARYWFVGSRGDGTMIGGEYDDAAEARFRDVVSTVVDGIEAGQFPANPGGEEYRFGAWSHDNCSWCAFDRVCPTSRGEAWVRIRTDPDLSGYVALAEDQVALATEAGGHE